MEDQIKKNGSQVLLDTLRHHGVDTLFGIPGGALLPFYDEVYDSNFNHYNTRMEQGAAFAAEGYARVTGKLGVAIGTSGPGSTNLLTGVANAKLDSIPVLYITGQVATGVIGTDAFQESDTYGMSIPVTKYNALVKNADDMARITEEAITVAKAKRPGPVLIDIPKDVQNQSTSNLRPQKLHIAEHHYTKSKIVGDLDKLISAINRASKPLLYVGGGAIASNASKNIIELATKAEIPVVTTIMGLGAFPGAHNLSLGMPGMHGTGYANRAIIEADFVLALGARFDDRVAGDPKDFAHQAVKAHIDIDPAELNKRVDVDIYIEGDLNEVLEQILPEIQIIKNRSWASHVQALKKSYPLKYNIVEEFIKPQQIIYRLWEKTKGDAIISSDVGQHQMWAALFYMFKEPRQWLNSGGLGSMGFGFPAGIGAKVGRPDKEVFVISGDGSFQMNIQELATIRQYNIKVKIIILNNSYLGMVRQWQEMFYDERFASVHNEFNPDFVKVAAAYNIPAKRIQKSNEIDEGLDFLMNTDDAALLEVDIPPGEKVLPMIPSGKKYEDMLCFDEKSEPGDLVTVIPNAEYRG